MYTVFGTLQLAQEDVAILSFQFISFLKNNFQRLLNQMNYTSVNFVMASVELIKKQIKKVYVTYAVILTFIN